MNEEMFHLSLLSEDLYLFGCRLEPCLSLAVTEANLSMPAYVKISRTLNADSYAKADTPRANPLKLTMPCVKGQPLGKAAGCTLIACHAGSIGRLAVKFNMLLHHAVARALSQLTKNLKEEGYCGLVQCVLRPNHSKHPFYTAWPHAIAALDRTGLKLTVDEMEGGRL